MQLGRPDVDAMLAEMSSAQFTEWMAYFAVEPFGSQLIDTHLAQFEALFANANRAKNQSAHQPREFLLSRQPTNSNPRSVFNKLQSFFTVRKGLKDPDG